MTASDTTSVFDDVQLATPIPIFKLEKNCDEDDDDNKINALIGAYRTNDSEPWILPVVKSVEAEMLNDPRVNHEYLPYLGLPDFCTAATNLCLGKDSIALIENRVTSIQSIGGGGGLRLSAEFLFKFYKSKAVPVYVPDPTYDNHIAIFQNVGFGDMRKYRYWSHEAQNLDFEGMSFDLRNAPLYSIVIFHACAHNPTGMDPSREQWKSLAKICKERSLFPLFDCAYLGLASGDPDEDAWAVRHFVSCGFELFACQSFSKTFGLYNERVGNLVLVLNNSKALSKVRSQFVPVARQMYTGPPHHGARIVATILQNPALCQEWLENLKTMYNRIKTVRHQLHSKLQTLETPGSWDHIINQKGMFCYPGLSAKHSEFMVKKKHIYMLSSGRINLCGLTTSNMDYFVQSMDEAVRMELDGKL